MHRQPCTMKNLRSIRWSIFLFNRLRQFALTGMQLDHCLRILLIDEYQ